MPKRTLIHTDFSTLYCGNHRYGFNGMESDSEVKGQGNSYDFGARIYDPRIGRWLSVDRHDHRYPSVSPYSFANNSPIVFVDSDGNDPIIAILEALGAMVFSLGEQMVGGDVK